MKKLTHSTCFVAGTLVWTDQGKVPIEKIKVGGLQRLPQLIADLSSCHGWKVTPRLTRCLVELAALRAFGGQPNQWGQPGVGHIFQGFHGPLLAFKRPGVGFQKKP